MREQKNWTFILPEVERCREKMHRQIDDAFNNFLLSLAGEDLAQGDGDRRLPLAAPAAMFKGTKPEMVILPDRNMVPVHTWKQAVSAILADCCADAQRREQMLELRGKVAGNFRYLLSDRPDGMSAPLKICEGLYVESKFDTEALLQNVTGKLLERVGYDYWRVVIQCRDPQQAAAMREADVSCEELRGNHEPEMAM